MASEACVPWVGMCMPGMRGVGGRLTTCGAGERAAERELEVVVVENDPRVNWTLANQRLWDTWSFFHAQRLSDAGCDIESLLRGAITLEERVQVEVGAVSGKRLVHLQCHLGLEALAWSRLGAVVTGIDFSTEAIRRARELSAAAGIPANFLCADVQELDASLDGSFEIVFTSQGSLIWIADLDRWAANVARLLTGDGLCYIIEYHPYRRLLQPRRVDATGCPVALEYFGQKTPLEVVEKGTYAVPDAPCGGTAYYWSHGLGEIVTAIARAGLTITFLHEMPGDLPNLGHSEAKNGGEFHHLGSRRMTFPHTFSLKATKRLAPR